MSNLALLKDSDDDEEGNHEENGRVKDDVEENEDSIAIRKKAKKPTWTRRALREREWKKDVIDVLDPKKTIQ